MALTNNTEIDVIGGRAVRTFDSARVTVSVVGVQVP